MVGVDLLDGMIGIIKHLGYFLRPSEDMVGGGDLFNFPDDDAKVADLRCIDFAEIVDNSNDIQGPDSLGGVGVLSGDDGGAGNGVGAYQQTVKEGFLI